MSRGILPVRQHPGRLARQIRHPDALRFRTSGSMPRPTPTSAKHPSSAIPTRTPPDCYAGPPWQRSSPAIEFSLWVLRSRDGQPFVMDRHGVTGRSVENQTLGPPANLQAYATNPQGLYEGKSHGLCVREVAEPRADLLALRDLVPLTPPCPAGFGRSGRQYSGGSPVTETGIHRILIAPPPLPDRHVEGTHRDRRQLDQASAPGLGNRYSLTPRRSSAGTGPEHAPGPVQCAAAPLGRPCRGDRAPSRPG